MGQKVRKKGKIKTYNSKKGVGQIITGKKIYEFYGSDLVYQIEIGDLRKDVVVEYLPEEGKTKSYARDVELADDASSIRYDLPGKFLYTRELGFDEWQTIEISKEPISYRSATSFNDALNELVSLAKSYGANALIDLNKIQSAKNKEEPYLCKAQFAIVAKQSAKGSHQRADLLGLNDRLKKLTKPSSNTTLIIASAAIILTISASVSAFLLLK